MEVWMLPRLSLIIVVLAAAVPAAAQPPRDDRSGRPDQGRRAAVAVAVEGLAGYAAFLDDSAIEHAVFGGAARVQLAPRHSLGPEVVYMRGPGFDRDWFVTANYIFDFIRQGERQPRHRLNPFLAAGVGFMRHQDQFAGAFSSTEGAFTAGGGLRVWLTDRVYALAELRTGWEPHLRVTGGIGVRLR
jgi:hypothetical protein